MDGWHPIPIDTSTKTPPRTSRHTMAYEASIDDEGMGIADTEKNTEESNTNANEYIDGIHVTVEYPAKDAVAEHHAPTSHNRASLTMEGDESREGEEEPKETRRFSHQDKIQP